MSSRPSRAFSAWGALAAVCAVLAVSCDGFHEKVYFEEADSVSSTPSFKRVRMSVLEPSCVGCHGAGTELDLSSYAEVRAHLGDIERAVFRDHTMPRNARLT